MVLLFQELFQGFVYKLLHQLHLDSLGSRHN